MPPNRVEALKIIAVKKVLGILGEDAINLLRYYLQHDYNISLDSNINCSCSLEQLHLALSRLFGTQAATLLLENVYIEIDRLSEAPKC